MFAYRVYEGQYQLRIGNLIGVYMILDQPIELGRPLTELDLTAAKVVVVEQWAYGFHGGYEAEPDDALGYTPYGIDSRDGPEMHYPGRGDANVIAVAQAATQNGFTAVLSFCAEQEAQLLQVAEAADLVLGPLAFFPMEVAIDPGI